MLKTQEAPSKNLAIIGTVVGVVALGIIAAVTQQIPMVVKALGPVAETILDVRHQVVIDYGEVRIGE